MRHNILQPMKILAVKCPKIVTQSCNKPGVIVRQLAKTTRILVKEKRTTKNRKSLILTFNKLTLNIAQF